jgi:hypothetical protein
VTSLETVFPVSVVETLLSQQVYCLLLLLNKQASVEQTLSKEGVMRSTVGRGGVLATVNMETAGMILAFLQK